MQRCWCVLVTDWKSPRLKRCGGTGPVEQRRTSGEGRGRAGPGSETLGGAAHHIWPEAGQNWLEERVHGRPRDLRDHRPPTAPAHEIKSYISPRGTWLAQPRAGSRRQEALAWGARCAPLIRGCSPSSWDQRWWLSPHSPRLLDINRSSSLGRGADPATPGLLSEKESGKRGGPLRTSWPDGRALLIFFPELIPE